MGDTYQYGKFYTEADIPGGVTTAYKELTLSFQPKYWELNNNNGTNYLEYSRDGVERSGKLLAGEIKEDSLVLTKFFIRGQAGTETFELWIYG